MSRDALDTLIANLQKSYSNGVIMDLRKGEVLADVERVPVESPKIGSLFGGGGIPRGRIIEIFGPESGGKTSMCEYIAGQFQNHDFEYEAPNGEIKTRKGVVVYIDAEHAISPDYALVHGFDMSKCILVQPDSGEQACDIAIKMAESGEIDLAVLDSIAAMAPQAEIDSSMDQNSIGLQARMLSKFFRKAAGVFAKTNTTLLCINQIRMNVGSYGNPETTCVVPDTLIQYTTAGPIGDIQPLGAYTLEDMFRSQGVKWWHMEPDTSISTDGNLYVLSCHPGSNKLEPKKVLKLVRKQDSTTYSVYVKSNTGDQTWLAFKGTPAHKVYAKAQGIGGYKWFSLAEISAFLRNDRRVWVVYSNNTPLEVEVKELVYNDCLSPILDMEVEDTHTYFAGGILSHNTGGKALKFYSSVRVEMRRREYITEKDEVKGIIINAKTVKNKTAPPMVKQQLEMYFDKSFDASMEWVDFAIDYQVITGGGGGFFTLPDGNKIRGRANVVEFYSKPENAEAYAKVKEMTQARMNSYKGRRAVADEEMSSYGEETDEGEEEFEE